MATGDVLSCVIDKTGSYAHIKLSALSAGGTYNFGTLPGSPTVTFTVTSPSFDNTGSAGTTTRTVLGTIQVAQPSGSHANTNVLTKAIPIGAVTGGPFVWGETITQTGSAATAVLAIGSPASPLITAGTVTGTPNSSGIWTGGTSGAAATPTATPTTYTGNPNWEGADGSDLWVRVALNEPIYSGDTSIKLNTSSCWYTGATATTNFSVTNGSSLGYPKVIGRWATVCARVFSSPLTVELQAFHHFATGGKPCACVVFTATDGTHTVSQTVTAMTVSTAPLASCTAIPTSSATSGFTLGETIKQGTSNATATVYAIGPSVLFVQNVTGSPDATHNWVGQTSSTSMTPTDKPPIAPKVSVYAATFNPSSFTQSAQVTINFKAYPWIGDSSAPFDSSGNAAWPSNTFVTGPISFTADPGGTYGQTVCFVDQTSNFNTSSAITNLQQDEQINQATSGATAMVCYTTAGSPNVVTISEITGSPDNSHNWTGQTSGTVITPTSAPVANAVNANATAANINSPSEMATALANPAQFDTTAWSKIAAYNLAHYSRNNGDYGIVYIKKGRFVYGASNSGVVTANSWGTYTRAPGTATNDVRWIAKGALNAVLRGLQRVYDVDIYLPNSGNSPFIDGWTATWSDSNRFYGGTATSGGVIWDGNLTEYTNNAFSAVIGSYGSFGGHAQQNIFRGNIGVGGSAGTNAAMYVGNAGNKSFGLAPFILNNIIASFNTSYSINLSSSADVLLIGTNSAAVTNCAIVGNISEVYTGTFPATWVAADGHHADSDNVFFVHNTSVGSRSNFGYNDSTPASVKSNFTRKYNADTWVATKHDRFSNADATCNKAWSVAYGVGHVGNHMIAQSSTSFAPYYYLGIGCTDNAAANYTNDQGGTQDGDTQGAGGGNGDYHPAANSVLRGKVTDPVIPFDLAGTAIGVGGSAGALQPLPSPSGGGSGAAAAALEFFGMI